MTYMMRSRLWPSLGFESSLILGMRPGRNDSFQGRPIRPNDCLMIAITSSDVWLVLPFCCSRSRLNAARDLFLSVRRKRQDTWSADPIREKERQGDDSPTGRKVVRVLGEDGLVELAGQGQDRLDVDEQLIDQTSNDEPRPETERESVSGKSLIRVQGRTGRLRRWSRVCSRQSGARRSPPRIASGAARRRRDTDRSCSGESSTGGSRLDKMKPDGSGVGGQDQHELGRSTVSSRAGRAPSRH